MGHVTYKICEQPEATDTGPSDSTEGSCRDFAYDIDAWRNDTQRATIAWYKEQAELKGLDWRVEFNRHIDRVRERNPLYHLRKVPMKRRGS